MSSVPRRLTAFTAVLLVVFVAGFAAGRVIEPQPPAEGAPHSAMTSGGR